MTIITTLAETRNFGLQQMCIRVFFTSRMLVVLREFDCLGWKGLTGDGWVRSERNIFEDFE